MNKILLALAVGVVGFGMSSCAPKTEVKVENPIVVIEEVEENEPTKKLKVIAMVNSDTILSQYEYALFLRDELTAQSLRYEGVLRKSESKLRSEMEALQREAATLSQFEGQNRERKLYQDQEKLQLKQEEYARKLMVIEQGYNRDIHNAIKEFLSRYCADKSFEMVLSNSDLGIIRWADESLDITDDVLGGLNEEYQAKLDATKTEAK